MITTFIDGIEMPTPGNMGDLATTLVRDRELRMIRITYPESLDFAMKAYRHLRDKWCEDKCATAEVRIIDKCGDDVVTVLSGRMLLADAEWRLHECTVSCPVQDLSTGSRLISGKDADLSPTTTQTFGEVLIDPAPTFQLEINPLSGTGSVQRTAYKWLDVMGHAIKVLTDDEAQLVSWPAIPDDMHIAIASCYELRTSDAASPGAIPRYTFHDLWHSVARIMNWWLVVIGDEVKILTDEETYGITGVPLITVDGAPELVQSMDEKQLYGTIRVGDTNTRNNFDGGSGSVPYIPMVGMTPANVGLTDTCSRDKILDLQSRLIIDTNVVENIVWLDTSSTTHDDKSALLQFDITTSELVRSSFLQAQQPMYNRAFTNIEVLRRYAYAQNSWLPQGFFDNAFRAQKDGPYTNSPGVQYSIGMPIETLPGGFVALNPQLTGFGGWPDTTTPPNFDAWGVWNFGNRYVAPDDGLVTFEMYASVFAHIMAGGLYPNMPLQFYVDRLFIARVYDDSATLVATHTFASPKSSLFVQFGSSGGGSNPNPPPGPTTGAAATHELAVNLLQGWYVEFDVEPRMVMSQYVFDLINVGAHPIYNFTIGGGSYIKASKTVMHIDVGSGDLRRVSNKLSRHLPARKWEDLITHPTEPLNVSFEGRTYRMHLDEITRKIADGTTEYTLLTRDDDHCQ